MLVGYGVGTGNDLYLRLLARHIGRHIPGKPIMAPENMPGAGGIVMLNYLYNVAPRDGSEIAMLPRGAATQPLLDPKDHAPKYIATTFNWIGTPQQEVGLLLVRQTPLLPQPPLPPQAAPPALVAPRPPTAPMPAALPERR